MHENRSFGTNGLFNRFALTLCAGLAVACGEEGGGNPMMMIGPSTMAGSTGFPPAGMAGMPSAGMGMPMAMAGRMMASAGRSSAGASAAGAAGGTAGAGGSAGDSGSSGAGTSGGEGGEGGAGVGGSLAGAGGAAGGTGGAGMMGSCCADGDCLCHGPDPMALTSSRGPFRVESFSISQGTVYYPTDATPPFAAVAICGGLLNTGPEMESWGPFYASHGIVTIITWTGASDQPSTRARALLGAIAGLKQENTKSGSPLSGKLAGRYGTSGYSMGGGGTTIAASQDSTLKTSVGLAAYGGTGSGVQVATLLLCGTSDGTAPCSMSRGDYTQTPNSTPKMLMQISGATHFSWFGPGDAGRGTSGSYALAFQKVFLEGDERWKPLLLMKPSNAEVTTNIQ